jgi:hypothetical protein
MDDQYTHPMTRTLQVAWAAGFLDGEGCFALSKANGKGCHETTKNAVLAVSQTRTAPLDRLADLFGGTVRPARMTAAGNLNYQWAITGSQLVPVLEELIPHLVLKQSEARAVLAYAKTIGPRGYGPMNHWTQIRRKAIIARHTSTRGGERQHG